MKAQLCVRIDKIENHPLMYTTVEDPKPEPDEVLIKIRACGVCYSNLHMIEGELKQFGVPNKLPIIPGHEVTGTIEELGNPNLNFKKGDRVGVQVLWKADGTCEFCQTGRENLCLNRQTTGETHDGGFAEYMTAPANFIYRLPENLRFEESAPLFCPGVTGYHAVKRANVRFGQKIAIIGIGGVGYMTLQFAKLAGATTIAVDRDKPKLQFAHNKGADYTLTPDKLEDFTLKMGRPDVVFVHAPSQKAIDQATRIIKRGGTIVMGVFGNAYVAFPEEYSVIGSIIGTRYEVNETLKLASMKKIKTEYTVFKLSQAEDVLLKLKQGKIIGRAILVPD
ncbi:MAG TPA: alcohol dehydrogenase catalytic domain-containing protein [Candidatus Sulfotelmatobacter sp.]|nr:alcohol dehydrogenase catalytic domain-containing protein [Candidatus Sulfotelmatobacter sp.]